MLAVLFGEICAGYHQSSRTSSGSGSGSGRLLGSFLCLSLLRLSRSLLDSFTGRNFGVLLIAGALGRRGGGSFGDTRSANTGRSGSSRGSSKSSSLDAAPVRGCARTDRSSSGGGGSTTRGFLSKCCRCSSRSSGTGSSCGNNSNWLQSALAREIRLKRDLRERPHMTCVTHVISARNENW